MGNINDFFDTGRNALQEVQQRLQMPRREVPPRREFLQFCATVAATLGLPAGAEAAVAKAVESAKRPSVIWLHFQECTGCSESLLRAEHPTLEKLILDVISLDYHETLMAAAGHQAEAARKEAMKANKGKYVLVIEGAIPTKQNGIYCKVGGHTAIDLTKECAADAAAGLCARSVVVSDRSHAFDQAGRRGSHQHHARPSRSPRHHRELCRHQGPHLQWAAGKRHRRDRRGRSLFAGDRG